MSKSSKPTTVGHLKATTLIYKWEIHNFCTGCKKVGESFRSPKFQSKDQGNQLEWYLELYPKGNTEEDKGYLSLFLGRIVNELGPSDYTIESVQLSILKDASVKTHLVKLQKKVFDNNNIWGRRQFIHRNVIMDAKNGLLTDDTLTILCEIFFEPTSSDSEHSDENLSDEESSSNEDKVVFVAKTYEANYRQELNDFEKLLENKTFSDVTFMVGKKKIFAHKAILASRSPVFQAMFETNMKESKENIVKITDIKYEVLEQLLKFIYASRVNDIKNMASDLLVAAEKYSILGLKTLCEKTLLDSLTVDNAIEYLILSDACNTIRLKSQVIEFIVSNRKDIVSQPEFKLLHSDIMCQVVEAIVKEDEFEI